MAAQESIGNGVADTFAPVVSNAVKVEERAECENLGVSSCMVEQEMGNDAPITTESTRVLKVDGEACESAGISSCNIEEAIGSINLADGLQSSGQEMKTVAKPIPVESTSNVEVSGEVRQELDASGCNTNIEEGVGCIRSVSGLGSSVISGKDDEKSEIETDEGESESSESEGGNPSSRRSASSGSSSDSDDSSTSGVSSDHGDSEDSEEDKHREEEKMTRKIEVEHEEGEIKDSGGQELDTDTAASDDEDAREVSWSGINDEDDDDDPALEEPIRSKNELMDLPLVPPVNAALEPHHQMLPVGAVMSIVGSQVIVEGKEKHDPLNEGSILWITETRTPLGLVDEIFGPVKNPYYTVRYNSENEIPKSVRVGTSISFVGEFANHVLNNKDLYKKGYDASGLNDEELSDEFEFSDDEKEAEYRKMHKMMKRGMSDKNHGKQSKHKNNKEKASRNNRWAAPPYPVPSSSTHNHETFPSSSGIRPGPFVAAPMVPPYPLQNPGPNLAPNEVWTNGMPLMQRQPALLPNGFPLNGMPIFPGNTQNPYQLPMTGIQFQPQFGSQPLPGTNTFAQPMYYPQPQGLPGAHPMNFGMNFPQQIQAPVSGGAGEQGSSLYGMQPGINQNFRSGPQNRHAPNQLRSSGSANRGRGNFHQRGRKNWRPTK